jgi:hypothetical protein
MADKPSDKPSAPVAPEPVFVPFEVVAIALGTYPRAKGGRPVLRQVGEKFLIYEPQHFAEYDPAINTSVGWMRRADAPALEKIEDPELQTSVPNLSNDPMALFRK